MIDETDRRLLSELRANARISNVDLAQKVNLSPTPCLRRVKKLEQSGVIKGYETVLDFDALGYGVSAIVSVKLTRKSLENAEQFERDVARLDAVTECFVITGTYDYVLRIVARDLNDYEMILKKHLATIETIGDMESTIILKQVDCPSNYRIPA